ncbi:MAG: ABC transporter ATP-binding protein [Alphaproteobacteria bacterium]|nr:ABC transporter ATP-binding protein [Alphaproteobacteria bacterium]
MLMASGATILLAKMIEPMLDRIFDRQDSTFVLPIAGALIAIGIMRGIGVYGQTMLMAQVSNAIIRDIRSKLFGHLMRADLALFQSVSTGHLMSRISGDTDAIKAALAGTFVAAGRDFFTAFGLVVLMFYQDWQLALFAVVGIPIVIYVVVRLGQRMRRLSRATHEKRAALMTLFDEAFRGARNVKSYAMEEIETRRAAADIGEIYRLQMKQEKTRAIINPFIELIFGVAIACVVTYGGYQVIAGAMTGGEFFSFLAALMLCLGPSRRLTQVNLLLQNGLAATQRVFDLMDVEPTIVDRPGAVPLRVDHGEIKLDNVRFSYVNEQAALEGVSLTVPAGKTAALVGPSGAGKSTVLNVIPRFYDIDAGAVTIDGQDVRGVTMKSLRAAIGLVSQEVTLFDDTVRANIAYGRPDASDAEIVAAARRAGAHEFISALPDQYDTVVGGRGERLSGGQRQRIAIARAMIKNAPILLLDEATSSLDTTSERQIQAALAELMRGRTTLVVAHRLSTIIHADIIYVIDGGRIIESGSHHELLARGNLYARLQAAQSVSETKEPLERRARA